MLFIMEILRDHGAFSKRCWVYKDKLRNSSFFTPKPRRHCSFDLRMLLSLGVTSYSWSSWKVKCTSQAFQRPHSWHVLEWTPWDRNVALPREHNLGLACLCRRLETAVNICLPRWPGKPKMNLQARSQHMTQWLLCLCKRSPSWGQAVLICLGVWRPFPY